MYGRRFAGSGEGVTKPITFVTLSPITLRDRFRTNSHVRFAIPFRRGDVIPGGVIFRMRRWYWPWAWKELAATIGIMPPLWDDFSLKYIAVHFHRVGPLFFGRKVWIFAK